jgi:hypothetical protein
VFHVVILLAIALISLFLMGYLLMDRLDQNLKSGIIHAEAESPADVMHLIFGSARIVQELEPALEKEHVHCRITSEMKCPKGIRCQHVLAVSDSDLDNLLFCGLAKHAWPEVHLTARCNDRLHKGVFREAGIHKIIMDRTTPDSLVSLLKGGGWKLS